MKEVEDIDKEIKRLQQIIEEKKKEKTNIYIKNGKNKAGRIYYDVTEYGQKRYVDDYGNLYDIDNKYISTCDSPAYQESARRYEYENNPDNFTLEERIKKLEAAEFWRDREETM